MKIKKHPKHHEKRPKIDADAFQNTQIRTKYRQLVSNRLQDLENETEIENLAQKFTQILSKTAKEVVPRPEIQPNLKTRGSQDLLKK